MPRLHLTDLAIDKLKPTDKQVRYYCQGLPHFGILVSPGGTKSFFLDVGHDRKRVSLGKWPKTSLKDARRAAATYTETEPETAIPSQLFDTAFTAYHNEHLAPNCRPSYARKQHNLFARFPFATKDLARIEPQELTAYINGLSNTPAAANYAHASLNSFFKWCITKQLIEKNPLLIKRPNELKSRERTLAITELQQIWQAVDGPYGDVVRLLILSGQRRGATAALQQKWIATDLITFPAQVMKNKVEHKLPVTDAMQTYLAHIPFPTIQWNKEKEKLNARLKLEPWTLHDLRRTFATLLAELQVFPDIIERLLAHTLPGEQSRVASVYNRFKYIPQMRQALLTYHEHLAKHFPLT